MLAGRVERMDNIRRAIFQCIVDIAFKTFVVAAVAAVTLAYID